MKLKRLDGRIMGKNCSRYLIHWYGKSKSKLQLRAKQLLCPIWKADIVFEEFPVFGTRLKVDFLNATRRIAIEVQGPQHNNLNKFFHRNEYGFVYSLERDMTKMKWLELNGFRLVEVVEKDLETFRALYKRIYRDGNI